MQRRDFLKTSVAALVLPGGSPVRNYGWLPPFLPSQEPGFLDTFPQLEGSGNGKIVLLYKYLEAILKQPLIAHKQKGPDCTSHAGGLGIDFLQAIQKVLKRDRWINETATEVLYIGPLNIIGKRKEGGIGIGEFVTFLKKYGTVFRRKYRKDFNFETYNYDNCKQLLKLFPEWLLEECKKCQIIKAHKVSSWNEAKDAIRSLYPVVIGSDVGFNNAKRDKDGFAKPDGKWYHAWLLIAIDDKFKRPGGCLMSSHGDTWVKGPRRYRQPKGSIWVDKDVLHTMLNKFGDSYALCQLNGLKPKEYKLW